MRAGQGSVAHARPSHPCSSAQRAPTVHACTRFAIGIGSSAPSARHGVELRRAGRAGRERVEHAGAARARPSAVRARPRAARPSRATSRTARSRRGGRRAGANAGCAGRERAQSAPGQHVGRAEPVGGRRGRVALQRARPQQPAELRAGAGAPAAVRLERHDVRARAATARAQRGRRARPSRPPARAARARRAPRPRRPASRRRRAAAPASCRPRARCRAPSDGSLDRRRSRRASPAARGRPARRAGRSGRIRRRASSAPREPAGRRPPGRLELGGERGVAERVEHDEEPASSRRRSRSRGAAPSRTGQPCSANHGRRLGRGTRAGSCPAPRRSPGRRRRPGAPASARRVARATSGAAGSTCSAVISESRPNSAWKRAGVARLLRRQRGVRPSPRRTAAARARARSCRRHHDRLPGPERERPVDRLAVARRDPSRARSARAARRPRPARRRG